MKLPRIQAARETEQPAVEARTYPDLYLTMLVLRTDEFTMRQGITATFRNYNQEEADLDPDPAHAEQLYIGDLFAEASRSPLVAQLLGLSVACLNLLHREQTLLRLVESTEDEAFKAEWAGQLRDVRRELGVAE